MTCFFAKQHTGNTPYTRNMLEGRKGQDKEDEGEEKEEEREERQVAAAIQRSRKKRGKRGTEKPLPQITRLVLLFIAGNFCFHEESHLLARRSKHDLCSRLANSS